MKGKIHWVSMYDLGVFPCYTHGPLGSLIQLGWIYRSWPWPHSLWPRLTNISHCHQTALRWQTRVSSVTKPGVCPVSLSWAHLPLQLRNASGETATLWGLQSRQLSPCLHPESLVQLLSYTEPFLEMWPLRSKSQAANHLDFETPNLFWFWFLYHHRKESL